MRDVVFLSGKRTPFGSFGGSLKEFSANDLGAHAAKAALRQAGIDPAEVGHVVFGNALQTSADAIYHARHVGLKAGLPVEVPALTVNRLCGSGFQAIVSGAEQIMLGETEVALCGGAESMSQAPHVIRGARWGALRLGEPGGNFEDLLWTALTDTQCDLSMAQTAEKLAEQYGITREEADHVAFLSQQRADLALGLVGEELGARVPAGGDTHHVSEAERDPGCSIRRRATEANSQSPKRAMSRMYFEATAELAEADGRNRV